MVHFCASKVVICLLLISDNFQFMSCKVLKSKPKKRFEKSQVDIKSTIYPCTIDDEIFLNLSSVRNSKDLLNCKRKLVIKMTINSLGECGSKSDGFIPVDQVIDGLTGRKKRLLNPFMIRLKREKMYQFYDLHLVKTVNAEAKEEVVNYENTEHFTGCDTSSSRPTCGFTFTNNKIMQFSEGFCCSCDKMKNDIRFPCEGRHGQEIDYNKYIVRHRVERDLEDTHVEGGKKEESSKNMEGNTRNDGINDRNCEENDFATFPNASINSFVSKTTEIPQNISTTFQSLVSNTDFVVKRCIKNINKNKSEGVTPTYLHSSNTISQERLKIYMMNKIKRNKKKEKVNARSEEINVRKKRFIVDVSEFSTTDSIIRMTQSHSIENNLTATSCSLYNSERNYTGNKVPTLHPNQFVEHLQKLCNASLKNISEHKTGCNAFKQKNCNHRNQVSKFEHKGNLSNMEDLLLKLVPMMNMDISENSNCVKKDSNTTKHVVFEINNSNDNNSKAAPLFVQTNSYGERNRREVTFQNKLMGSEVQSDTQVPLGKRETPERQIRGGQSCSQSNKTLPPDANADTYFESAHCLRYSDLWYNVHRITNPRLENSITVKVFSKHRSMDKKICWENLTKRLSGRVGTMNEVLTNDGGTLVIYYTSNDRAAFSLDCSLDMLLVPQPLPSDLVVNEELTAVNNGGPEEYLIVKESQVAFDGDKCDRAGVSFSAFVRQPHRCERPVNTCLRNQPLHFWRRDKKALRAGKKGQYFLGNFINISDQAILQNTSCNQVVLKAPYQGHFESHVVIEIDADGLEIVGDRSVGQVTEVYIDATLDNKTKVRAMITNMGLATNYFGVDFANCTAPLGLSNFDKSTKDEIPPQHRITYTATISSTLINKRIQCNLIVSSLEQEVVASRSIVIVQGQHCMCIWYCRCVCYVYPHPGLLPCDPLSVRDYNVAGFPGQLPVTTSVDCSMLFYVLLGLLWLFLFLLFIGLLKAVIGLCVSSVAAWGLWYLLPEEAQGLCAYMEISLVHYPIMRDAYGFPVHPHTFKRTVHFLPCYSEFVINMVFFICVLRTCLCDNLSRRASTMMFSQYQSQQGKNCCSPGRCPPNHTSCNKDRIRLLGGVDAYSADSLADERAARRVVDNLVRAYVVFRNLTHPEGGVSSSHGQPYSIRGFFLESDNGAYQFTPPSPLMQIWNLDNEPMEPPGLLEPGPFTTVYHSATQILREGQLSLYPRGIVINAP